MNQILNEIKEIATLKREYKRKSMIFNCQYKEDRAKDLGLPLWAFYHVAYKDLGLLDDNGWARKWFDDNRDSSNE